MGLARMPLPGILRHLQRKFDEDDFRAINEEIEQIEADAFTHVFDTVADDDSVKDSIRVVDEVASIHDPDFVVEIAKPVLLDVIGVQFDADQLGIGPHAAQQFPIFAFAGSDVQNDSMPSEAKIEFDFRIECCVGKRHS